MNGWELITKGSRPATLRERQAIREGKLDPIRDGERVLYTDSVDVMRDDVRTLLDAGDALAAAWDECDTADPATGVEEVDAARDNWRKVTG